jgi:hypothetical protein
MLCHDDQTINACLTEARGKVRMLMEMADQNMAHAEAHDARWVAKEDRKMFRKLHKALALLQECER